jgi:predicted ATPase/DNA-binding winged helix-turn-helix (wHTH) protein
VSNGTRVLFPPFILDPLNQTLLRGPEKIFLRPKSFHVLSYLVQHPHRLVSKDDLTAAAWQGAKVVDAALRVSIQEIRKALGDTVKRPRFIETVGRSGYWFIAPISIEMPGLSEAGGFQPFVGRNDELRRLQRHLELAHAGQRQIVFISGEAGIGKSTLTHALVNGSKDAVLAVQGQCIEQYGRGAAFLPILDVLEQLCRSIHGAAVIDLLRRWAASWLIDLPVVDTSEGRNLLAGQRLRIPPERRLREITAFFEEVVRDRTMILILEDLHWADPSTVALISFLARRREPARLMLIGTYRNADAERQNRAVRTLVEELKLHNQGFHLPLKLLSRLEVKEYLGARFNSTDVSSALIDTIYARSEGNPLFMINVIDYLCRNHNIIREKNSVQLADLSDHGAVPSTIRNLIIQQLEMLPADDQEVLETASVAGAMFQVSLVAKMLRKTDEAVERRCQKMARGEQFLCYFGIRRTPSGLTTPLYGFLHAVYQSVVYDRVAHTRRTRLHRRLGERLERVFTGNTDQVAAELARHFELAGDARRAIHYYRRAARQSRQRSALREARG